MKKKILFGAKIICIAVILLSIAQLVRISNGYLKSVETVSSLKNEILTDPPVEDTEDRDEGNESHDTDIIPIIESTAPVADVELTEVIAAKFESLYEKNNDFVGWLTVDGTNIDYPVLQSKDDPELYLRHDFNKQYDVHGSIFLISECNVFNGDNLIIHGHNMRDGTMFSQLGKFADKAFCEEEHLITFDTIYGETFWKPILVFKISSKGTESFPYHTITDFESANDYIERGKYTAIWDSGEDVPDDTRLLTLSTCEYTLSNGRLVVVAKKIY